MPRRLEHNPVIPGVLQQFAVVGQRCQDLVAKTYQVYQIRLSCPRLGWANTVCPCASDQF